MRIVVEPWHVALESKELHMLATNVWPADAVTPQVAKLTVSEAVLEVAKFGHSSMLVGAAVGKGDGLGVGAVGAGEGIGVGKKACTVGAIVGNIVGVVVGSAVVGPNVGKNEGKKDGVAVGMGVGGVRGKAVGPIEGGVDGTEEGGCVGTADGANVGATEGRAVGAVEGAAVGVNETSCKPVEPATTVVPAHDPAAVHPCRIMYVCIEEPAGTVNWTCEQVPHEAGAVAPEPVLSYATSTPNALKMRIVVEPVHAALESKSLHMLATNVWPADAVTPQVAKLTVSDAVLEAVKGGQIRPLVGAAVRGAVGSRVGAVGVAVGTGVGTSARNVGIAEGITVGKGDGGAVVGPIDGRGDGAAVGRAVVPAVGAIVGIEDGAGEGRIVGEKLGGAEGNGVGAKLTTVTPLPATADLPWHPVAVPKHPCQITYVCVGVPAGTVYWICAQFPQADGATPEPEPVLS